MVRGREVLNDATAEDAQYTKLDEVAEIISNGDVVAGFICDMLPEETKTVLDGSDVIFLQAGLMFLSLPEYLLRREDR